MFNFDDIKNDFPILSRKINDKHLVYLDNAATTQKPNVVVEAIKDYYFEHNANVHRGIHTLSEEATMLYEATREKVKNFIGARSADEIIFTKGTTESINFIAQVLTSKLTSKDVILVTEIEHHSNLIPWQQLALRTGAKLDFVASDKDGNIDTADLTNKLNENVKVLALTHASNVLGTILPVKEISKKAHEFDTLVVVDGAQAIPHMEVNVQSLGCDVYASSAHKMLGPTGVGVLWAKKELLSDVSPYQFGGGMIDNVDLKSATWAASPEKFEAGTPNIEGVVAFGAAIDYLSKIEMRNIKKHEETLNAYALKRLAEIANLTFYGTADPASRTGLISFTIAGLHAHDISAVLNSEGIAVRSGHHCAQPLHTKLGLGATVRASFYIYNQIADIDALVNGLHKAIKILS